MRKLRRARAVFWKELRDYKRNVNVLYAMIIFPVIFLIQPLIQILTVSSGASHALHHEHSLVYMLAIPALVPAMLASYAVVGERLQGTMEPVLTTPIKREELLLGKALAALIPSIVIAYGVFGLFIAVVELFAHAGIASALVQWPDILAQVVFTPLIAILSIWVGMGVSTRCSDPRTAGQLAVFATLPVVAMTTLVAFGVIPATLRVAFSSGIGLAIIDRIGLRLVSAHFDRERLVSSTR